MGIKEQTMMEDVRKDFRMEDMRILAAIMAAEDDADDGGGMLVGEPQKRLVIEGGSGSDTIGDADVDDPTHKSIETRPVENDDDPVLQAYDWTGTGKPPDYTYPKTEEAKPLFLVRSVETEAENAILRYAKLVDILASMLAEMSEGDGITIDPDTLTISADAGLPDGGLKYQVLQVMTEAADAVGETPAVARVVGWDWLRYVVPSGS